MPVLSDFVEILVRHGWLSAISLVSHMGEMNEIHRKLPGLVRDSTGLTVM